jgi:hypothetical protein
MLKTLRLGVGPGSEHSFVHASSCGRGQEDVDRRSRALSSPISDVALGK